MKETVRNYLSALEAGDATGVVALFEPDGWVLSPFLGKVPATEFFPKLVEHSSGTKLTVHDILVSAEGRPIAIGYFLYDWGLRGGSHDGSKISFECADVFTFNPTTGKIVSLVILYDTHPIWETVGNKFA